MSIHVLDLLCLLLLLLLFCQLEVLNTLEKNDPDSKRCAADGIKKQQQLTTAQGCLTTTAAGKPGLTSAAIH
jgi:hypothetical protein